MEKLKEYRIKHTQLMRPYIDGEVLLPHVSISETDRKNGSPKVGDMIAVNPVNANDSWLVNKDFFEANYEEVIVITDENPTDTCKKSLHNTDINGARKNVRDIVVFGDGDLFKLISKASSEKEGWMKSTKAMEIGNGRGCIVQVTTQQRNPDGSYSIAEALTYVPNCWIKETGHDENGKVTGRNIVPVI